MEDGPIRKKTDTPCDISMEFEVQLKRNKTWSMSCNFEGSRLARTKSFMLFTAYNLLDSCVHNPNFV